MAATLWATQFAREHRDSSAVRFLSLGGESRVASRKTRTCSVNFGRQQGVHSPRLQRASRRRAARRITLGGLRSQARPRHSRRRARIDRTRRRLRWTSASILEGCRRRFPKAADEMRKKLAGIGIGAKEGADAAAKALESLIDKLTGKTILAEAIKWEAALKAVGQDFHRLDRQGCEAISRGCR